MIEPELLIGAGATVKKVKATEVIFQEGEPAAFYFQLLEGSVSWSNFHHDGKETLQALAGPGECFGELPVFDRQPYACSAVAETDCLVIKLGIDPFHRLLQEHPEISMMFNQMLSQKLRFKLFLVKQLASHSPEQTVWELYKYLQRNTNNVCHNCGKVLLTRQQIANLTGMRVETVIRATKSLEMRGSVRIAKGKVFLKSLDRLQGMQTIIE
ncbi:MULTISPECIES: Crp/Fnr family transcriptional regulator [Dyadobacter]|jgi:CRP-like cAMP-binding protein|uniref:CRP-like cAMP-activated global transcriptional regulator n=1 Tax=Dyadobacter helix TaxID=2822344 RepID=A0A916N4M0_9BACT|nr:MULTISPECIES: Crp/Fnr family transcriptional regulator [unclassified Dyadobacter]OJV22516.1 MAG: hypothetical protein BGO21_14190 [Dyadobacter sp. 50-39]CAG5001316.1 CRP-like cAMP-activated global transcriptional regulator [Dyadobacter sp. CECT 9275]